MDQRLEYRSNTGLLHRGGHPLRLRRRHRLVSQTSKRNFATIYDYDFAGRHIQANWPDGSTPQVAAAEVVGVIGGGIRFCIATSRAGRFSILCVVLNEDGIRTIVAA